MSRGLPGIAALALVAAAAPALADDAAATDDEDTEPAPQQVHVEATGTTFVVSARFGLDLDGPTTSEGATMLTLPPAAMVTRATATIGSIRHPLELVDADAAEQSFSDLLEVAPSSNRKSMIVLSARDQTLTLDTALPQRTHVLLDLRLEMPTCFFRDVRYAMLPTKWFAKLDVVRPHIENAELDTACTSASGDGAWIALPSRELAKKPAGEGRVGAIGGRLELDERHLARIELDLSRELSVAPADLHTAIVVDHSRSVQPNELEAERAIVASYLQHAPPQSRVQVIGYARKATALLPDWLPVASSAPRVDREIRALAPRNGSNVDSALAEAGRWLARVKGTRRVILLTDDRLSERIEGIQPATFKRVLPDGTLVHVVSIFDGQGTLTRNDETPLAPLAMATEGLAVSGSPDEKTHQVDATLLVRPISVDNIHIAGAGWTRLGIGGTTCPAESTDDLPEENLLVEGDSCTWWGKGDAVSGPITVEGFIWGRRITRVVHPDPSQGVALARELSTSRAFESDDDETLQTLVDRAALAVNSAWSLVGTWGGGGGYADGEGIGGIIGGSWDSCCGDMVGIGGIGHGMPIPPLDLRKQLAPIVARCGASGARFAITVETTAEEIVDVRVDSIERTTPALQTCLVEGVWDLSLAIPDAPWRTTTRTEF